MKKSKKKLEKLYTYPEFRKEFFPNINFDEFPDNPYEWWKKPKQNEDSSTITITSNHS